jgi:hypothetical protein
MARKPKITAQSITLPDGTVIQSVDPNLNLASEWKKAHSEVLLYGKASTPFLFGRFLERYAKRAEAAPDSQAANYYIDKGLPILLEGQEAIQQNNMVERTSFQVWKTMSPWQREVFLDTTSKHKVVICGRRCFAEDTEIPMADGTIKKVQDLVVGDKLIGLNGPNEVVDTHNGIDDLYKITDNGTEITVNGAHILCLTDGTDDLEISVEDFLLRDDQEKWHQKIMFGYIYKIIWPDGKYYIGRHKGHTTVDYYWSSSTYMARWKEKRGLSFKHNASTHHEILKFGLKKEIMHVCYSKEELNQKEDEEIAKVYKKDPLCMNWCYNTYGNEKTRTPWNKGKKGVYSKETLKKMSDGVKKANGIPEIKQHILDGNRDPNRWKSEETRRAAQRGLTGQNGQPPWNKGKTGVYSEETRKALGAGNRGRKQSEEEKKKRVESLRLFYIMHPERKWGRKC